MFRFKMYEIEPPPRNGPVYASSFQMYKKIAYTTVFLFTFAAACAVELFEGAIDGAPYQVAVPEGWSGGPVFFHVHGWRPDDAPHLADMNPGDPFYVEMLDSGWVIRPPHRRNVRLQVADRWFPKNDDKIERRISNDRHGQGLRAVEEASVNKGSAQPVDIGPFVHASRRKQVFSHSFKKQADRVFLELWEAANKLANKLLLQTNE